MSFVELLNTTTGWSKQVDLQNNLKLQDDAQAFNAEQALLQREHDKHMSSTAYQRAVADMEAAGLNPAAMFGTGSGGAASSPHAAAANSNTGSVRSSSNVTSMLLHSLLDSFSGDGKASSKEVINKLGDVYARAAAAPPSGFEAKSSDDDVWMGFEVA